MTMSPAIRKLALTVHLISSVGWVGAVVAYVALGVAAVASSDPQVVRASWIAMDVTGWWVIVPLAIAALATGIGMSLGTPWGLFRHYWTLISLVLTAVCSVVLVLHMPTVSETARAVQQADTPQLRALGGDLFHPTLGLALLLAITFLNVYKPAGVTPYGWHKRRQEIFDMRARTGSEPAAASTPLSRAWQLSGVSGQRSSRAPGFLARAGFFVCHLAEMVFAMFLGMAVFMLLRVALTPLGVPVLLDPIQFEVGMGVFMTAPMVAWMRVRGCGWRECAEMSVGMMLPSAAAVAFQVFRLESQLIWILGNQHVLMLAGMVAVMLYRRDHFTSTYVFLGWTDPSFRRRIGTPEMPGI